jgi:hypothetical protein
MALAYGYVHRHHAPGQRFEGMCNVSIHRLLVVTQDGFLLLDSFTTTLVLPHNIHYIVEWS